MTPPPVLPKDLRRTLARLEADLSSFARVLERALATEVPGNRDRRRRWAELLVSIMRLYLDHLAFPRDLGALEEFSEPRRPRGGSLESHIKRTRRKSSVRERVIAALSSTPRDPQGCSWHCSDPADSTGQGAQVCADCVISHLPEIHDAALRAESAIARIRTDAGDDAVAALAAAMKRLGSMHAIFILQALECIADPGGDD